MEASNKNFNMKEASLSFIGILQIIIYPKLKFILRCTRMWNVTLSPTHTCAHRHILFKFTAYFFSKCIPQSTLRRTKASCSLLILAARLVYFTLCKSGQLFPSARRDQCLSGAHAASTCSSIIPIYVLITMIY